jgi:transcriptional regulator with XRE-family HTH domain
MRNQIRAIREKKGLSQHQLAELAHTTSAQVSRLESGARRLDMDWIERFATALDVSHAQIMGLAPLDFIDDVQVDATTTRVLPPIMGVMRTGGQVIAAEPGALEAFRPAGAVFDGQHLGALRVEGDAVGLALPNGCVLYYETRVYGVPTEFLGALCVVKCVDMGKKPGEIQICRPQSGKKIGFYRLQPCDPLKSTPDEVQIEWSARIRWVQLP